MVIEYLDARGPKGKMFPLHWRSRTFGRCTTYVRRGRQRRSSGGGVSSRICRPRWANAPWRRLTKSTIGNRLDSFGVDFALAADGGVLLFEANAAIVVLRPSARADLGLLSSRPRCRYTRGREAEWRCHASWLAEAGSDEFNRIATVAMMDASSAPASTGRCPEPPSTEARGASRPPSPRVAERLWRRER